MSDQVVKSTTDDVRVRDHLANERTYLAWMRTGVSTMGLGVVIAKLKYFLGPAYPETSGVVHAANIGIIFSLVGVATIGLSLFFFFRTRQQIRTSSYMAGSAFALVLAGLMIGLGVLIIWYLIQPTS
jgi:putative membrane protein